MMSFLIRILILIEVLCLALAKIAEYNLDEYNIILNITNGYNNLIRPYPVMEIDIKLSLKQINNLDEKNQILTSNSYFACFWADLKTE